MKKLIDLTLPEWAFLDAHSHFGNELGNRTVILHVRSASVIEIFNRVDCPAGLTAGRASHTTVRTGLVYSGSLRCGAMDSKSVVIDWYPRRASLLFVIVVLSIGLRETAHPPMRV